MLILCVICRARRSTEVTSPLGVFWVINASDGSLVWRLNFTRVEMFIDGRVYDFEPLYDAFQVSELLLRAFSRWVCACVSTINAFKGVFKQN